MQTGTIKLLLDNRDAILKKNYEDKEADVIQKKIISAIKNNFTKYQVDFIIETFTRFGASPNIIYDDNGLFAIVEDGIQPVAYGNKRIKGTFTLFVEKNQWKKSIREALRYYLSKH